MGALDRFELTTEFFSSAGPQEREEFFKIMDRVIKKCEWIDKYGSTIPVPDNLK